MAETVIATVLERVGSLFINPVVQETSLLRGVPEQVELMKAELRRLQSFLKDADVKWMNGDERAKNWVHELRDMAYEAENIVEIASYITSRRNNIRRGFRGALSRYAHKPSDLKKLHEVGIKIQHIKTKLSEISGSTSIYGIAKLDDIEIKENRAEDETLRAKRLVSPDSDDNVDVIGFDNYKDQIVEQLLNRENHLLTVVSIVGMGGLGKSTLARKVYNCSQVKQHFNVVAWVAVSQKYEVSHLLKEIKKQTMKDKSESLTKDEEIDKREEEIQMAMENITERFIKDEEKNEEEIRKALCDFLKERRYLIVLDDVWETTIWDQLQGHTRVFLEANRGSRILLTTRSLEVAKHVKQRSYIHELELLDSEKSWELLRSKAFPSYQDASKSSINELESLGKKLAKKCNGLPLALVVLGGYLSKNLNYYIWTELVDSMDWEVMDHEKNVRDVLSLSYHDLPHHYLKSCFLYIASFPEDYVVPVPTLIELWNAEGLVPHRQGRELEETARRALDVLAQRCMVQVAERSIAHGWINSVRIHDVLRDWGIEEGRKEGFIKVCSNLGDIATTYPDAMPAYRVTLHNFFDHKLGEAIPNQRTLLAFKLEPSMVPYLSGLKFLRVLHLEGLRKIKFPEEIKKMVHLRYLGFRDCWDVKLPSSIWHHLLNLQTLDARGTLIRQLHSSFWDIPTLRNVYLGAVNLFSPPNSSRRRSLRTLYITKKDYDCSNLLSQFRRGLPDRKYTMEATIKSLVGMTSLVSLTLKSRHSATIPSEVFSDFTNLRELSLMGRLTEQRCLPDGTLFPQNLRELSLKHSGLEEDPMPILENLPGLVVLKLISGAYKGRSMCCSSHGFPRLQQLILFGLYYAEEWKVDVGAMPRLTHLLLSYCHKLEMVPNEGLQRLTSLQELKLKDMDSLSMDSIKELKENGCRVISLSKESVVREIRLE